MGAKQRIMGACGCGEEQKRKDEAKKPVDDPTLAEEERIQKERADEERADKERADKERADEEAKRADEERIQKERADEERADKERADEERADEERAERERCQAAMEGRMDIVQAAEEGRIDLVKLVLQHTPEKVNDQDNHGVTALHKAAWISSLELAKVPVAANANVDILNSRQETALIRAAENRMVPSVPPYTIGSLEVAEVLVAANANLDFKSIAGATALEYAKEYKNHGIVTLLSSQ